MSLAKSSLTPFDLFKSFYLDRNGEIGEVSAMASNTQQTRLIRKKKRTAQAKDRKKKVAKLGTINYFDYFSVPAGDDPRKSSKNNDEQRTP